MVIADLPFDALFLILTFLDPRDLLMFAASCRAFSNPSLRDCPSYWISLIRSKFSNLVRAQPKLISNYQTPREAFRLLETRTKCFTWGQDEYGNLGRVRTSEDAFPIKSPGFSDLRGIIDLQCGGWSTCCLTKAGDIFIYGVIDSDLEARGQAEFRNEKPLQLRIPETVALSVSNDHRISSTRISQFSAGRRHVLGLSQSGHVWFWRARTAEPLVIRFEPSVTKSARQDSRRSTQVVKVAAGSRYSSAYLHNVGIVVWDPTHLSSDGRCLTVVAHGAAVIAPPEQEDMGEAVVHHVVLENYIVLLTRSARIFATYLTCDRGTMEAHDPFEIGLADLMTTPIAHRPSPKIFGSYSHLAILTKDQVFMVTETALNEHCLSTEPKSIFYLNATHQPPSLQATGVLKIAFGLEHFHALHDDGTITSHGTEPRSCGALGFGGADHSACNYNQYRRSRGVVNGGFGGSHFPDEVSREKRRVCFDRGFALEVQRCGGKEREGGCASEVFALAIGAGDVHSAAVVIEDSAVGRD